MTVNGLLSNAFQSSAAAAGLNRVSARPEAVSKAGGCDCNKPDCPTCGSATQVSATRDTLELSPEAASLLARESEESDAPREGELTEEEQQQVEELKARDQEVRQHEQAHLAAAGPYAIGGPTYEYQQGPDGGRYAIGGEVQIDSAPVDGDPAATIQKMQTVRAAALAPAEPSGQDRKVAAQASAEIQKAQAELNAQRQEEALGGEETEPTDEPSLGSVERPDTPRGERDEKKPRDPFKQQELVGARVDLAA